MRFGFPERCVEVSDRVLYSFGGVAGERQVVTSRWAAVLGWCPNLQEMALGSSPPAALALAISLAKELSCTKTTLLLTLKALDVVLSKKRRAWSGVSATMTGLVNATLN